jgi:hypothetical protein
MGYVDEELGEQMGKLYEQYDKMNIRASDERDDIEPAPPSDGASRGGATERTANSKF